MLGLRDVKEGASPNLVSVFSLAGKEFYFASVLSARKYHTRKGLECVIDQRITPRIEKSKGRSIVKLGLSLLTGWEKKKSFISLLF